MRKAKKNKSTNKAQQTRVIFRRSGFLRDTYKKKRNKNKIK